MGKKVMRVMMFITAGIITVFAVSYILLSLYYRNGFSYGTWINGTYCTGKSIDEVNDILTSQFHYNGINIKDCNGRLYLISADDIGYKFDFKKALKIYLDRQNSWLWPENLLSDHEQKLLPVVTYDKDLLDKKIAECPPFAKAASEKPEVRLYYDTAKGYVLINNSKNILDVQKGIKAVKDDAGNSQGSVDLKALKCYYDLKITPEMQSDIDLYKKIEPLQNQDIELDFGEKKEKIDSKIASGFIRMNEEGNIYFDKAGNAQLDSDLVEAYIDKLSSKYDTVGITRSFHSTSGRNVSIEGGTYGNNIDKKSELERLMGQLNKREKVSEEPVYAQKAAVQGDKNDIGNTYIEVDMSSQMLYHYVGGTIKLQTPVVTGNVALKRGTPAGVNYVIVKQKNRTLHGANYTSFVKLWMQVYKGIGIHDASWRDDYGGDIYETAGSHGCVNTPYDKMLELYNETEVGTPVVMFY